MRSAITVLAPLALILTACSGGNAPEVNEAQAAAVVANAQNVTDGTIERGLPISDNSAQLAPAALPPAFEGRWGITPADCDIARSDTRGLLVVRGSTLTFYDGAATAKLVGGASRYKVVADLSFGSGAQARHSRETLELVSAGTVLLRTAQSPAKTYRYERC